MRTRPESLVISGVGKILVSILRGAVSTAAFTGSFFKLGSFTFRLRGVDLILFPLSPDDIIEITTFRWKIQARLIAEGKERFHQESSRHLGFGRFLNDGANSLFPVVYPVLLKSYNMSLEFIGILALFTVSRLVASPFIGRKVGLQ